MLTSLLAFALVVAALHIATDHLVPPTGADAARHAGLCTLGHSPAVAPAAPPLPLPPAWFDVAPVTFPTDWPLQGLDLSHGIRAPPAA